MKDLMIDLANYHLWANKRLLDTIQGLPADYLTRELQSSFPTLELTLIHLLGAESLWLQRLQMNENPAFDAEKLKGDYNNLASAMMGHNESLVQWVQNQKEPFFEHTIAYYNSKKQYFKQLVYQCLLQVFNHGTYHRGQIVTMFHELGVTKIPATDYIAFKRKK
ncbi:MAG: DinB family protein [Chitinophagaceae bacterium]